MTNAAQESSVWRDINSHTQTHPHTMNKFMSAKNISAETWTVSVFGEECKNKKKSLTGPMFISD